MLQAVFSAEMAQGLGWTHTAQVEATVHVLHQDGAYWVEVGEGEG